MIAVNSYQLSEAAEKRNNVTMFPFVIETHTNDVLETLLANLTPDTPWGERQIAVKKLGFMRNPETLPALLPALLTDPFWMVRCTIIQALEMIGDPRAIPTLQEVERNDGFQIVRAYATKAIGRLAR